MTKATKYRLDTAITELKREGYSVLLLMFDKRGDESRPMGSALEVMCSETNNPALLAEMAKDALREISQPIQNLSGEIH